MAFVSSEWAIDYVNKTVTNDDSAVGAKLPAARGDNDYVGPILEWFQWIATSAAAASPMAYDYPIESQTPTVFKWLFGWTFGNANDYKYLNGGSIVDPNGSGSARDDSLWSNVYSIGSLEVGSQVFMIQNDAEITPWWLTGHVDLLVLVKNTGSWIQSVNPLGVPTNGAIWLMVREFGDFYDHNFSDLSGGGINPVGLNTAQDNGNQTGELYLTPAATTNFTAGSFVKGGTSNAVGKLRTIASGKLYLTAVRGGPYQTSETLVEYADRECQTALDGSTTNHASTAYTNVVAGYSDIKTVFVQRKFTGGTTSVATFETGEVLNQATSNWVGKFVAEVANVIYVQHTSGTADATHELTGASSGGKYTPSATAAETEVDLALYPGATAYPYNAVMSLNSKTTVQGYEWGKYITRYGSKSATYSINGDDGQEYRAAIEGTYTDRKVAPLGTLAGTTFYSERGIFITDAAAVLFVLIDADGQTRNPPNYQRAIASHASLSGCNVFVAEISGGQVVKNQYTYDDTNSDSTHLAINEAINLDKTPLSGIICVGDTQYVYTSFDTVTKKFVVTTDPTGETDNADLYIPFLYVTADAASEQSAQIVVGANVTVRTAVRKYGYKYYTNDTTFGAAYNGLAFSPILVVDPQQS